ncbi:GyrI-like domain-containing protein [Loigolactobacillus binensis]|uniref:GyrI-like domain-containing protein n=1 Tax=Loigolactobacillus binensis TaxID=2559922 RepID=A0ABW3EIC2_9LACO|nr:GyrI-like domain-containing protein [Loigolactobacillus binensis]
MAKYEWRKQEKAIYPNRKQPTIVTLGPQNFITLTGHGDPNQPEFSRRVAALYAISYTIKMAPKKGVKFNAAYDYTVFPLEAFWTLPADFSGDIQTQKHLLVYKIMLKQPNFVTPEVFAQAQAMAAAKLPADLLTELKLETLTEGQVAMQLHVGPFATEAESFAKLASYLANAGYRRTSQAHKEIYLSDFRRTAPEKLKTILRVAVARI